MSAAKMTTKEAFKKCVYLVTVSIPNPDTELLLVRTLPMDARLRQEEGFNSAAAQNGELFKSTAGPTTKLSLSEEYTTVISYIASNTPAS